MTLTERPIKLVLIDDDEGVLRALGMLLQALAFEVHAFNSGKEGVAFALQNASVELIVTDLRMPGFSGEDVVRELRARGSSLPIVVMSGHANTSDIQGLQSLGMDAFISKPFTPDIFLETARKVVAARSDRNAA